MLAGHFLLQVMQRWRCRSFYWLTTLSDDTAKYLSKQAIGVCRAWTCAAAAMAQGHTKLGLQARTTVCLSGAQDLSCPVGLQCAAMRSGCPIYLTCLSTVKLHQHLSCCDHPAPSADQLLVYDPVAVMLAMLAQPAVFLSRPDSRRLAAHRLAQADFDWYSLGLKHCSRCASSISHPLPPPPPPSPSRQQVQMFQTCKHHQLALKLQV